MYNWSTDTSKLAKDTHAYEKFRLESMINFGLDNGKLSLTLLKRHWDTLTIDPGKKNFLKKLVWPQS
ncbi:MAG: hypothetical protein WCL07_04540 [bacterium]